MAQVRLGRSIRNAIAEARPERLAADIYPPVASPPEGPSKPARPVGPAGARGPGAQAGIERQLADIRAAIAQLGARSNSVADGVLTLQDALDLVRRDVNALRDALKLQEEHIEAARASIWRRCDELEIKVRPMIPFDDESWAVRLMDGYVMIPRAEPMFSVMVANAGSGGLEPGTRRVLKSLIEPGMAVADVGANVGLLTLACALAAGPTGRVHAFEPEAGPRSQLAKTVKLNGLRWVEIHDCALGAKNERRSFHISPIIGHSSLYPLPQAEVAEGRDETISVMALDDVLPPGSALDVVKIDVEGAELDVLAGMGRLLAENADIALIAEFGPPHLRRVGIDPAAWFDAFAAQGFQTWAIDEPSGVCRPVRPEDVADVESVNLTFVRPGGKACARLPMAMAE
jgi:FkbM family methyltransferase